MRLYGRVGIPAVVHVVVPTVVIIPIHIPHIEPSTITPQPRHIIRGFIDDHNPMHVIWHHDVISQFHKWKMFGYLNPTIICNHPDLGQLHFLTNNITEMVQSAGRADGDVIRGIPSIIPRLEAPCVDAVFVFEEAGHWGVVL